MEVWLKQDQADGARLLVGGGQHIKKRFGTLLEWGYMMSKIH